MVGIARCPRLASHDVGLLAIGSHIAWRESVLHGKAIEERLDGRAHLPAPKAYHVVHEMRIVQSANVSLDGSRPRIHAHESAAEESLVVSYGVERTHQRVNVAMICEDGHLGLLPEGYLDILRRISRCLHVAVALALHNAAVEDGAYLLGRQLVAVGGARLGTVLLVKGWLQIARHMLVDGLLGIALHTAVDGGEHLQAVGIDIIVGAVLLVVLVAPSVERVAVPGNGVDDKLHMVPRGVVGTLRPFGHHVLTQKLAQVGGGAVLVVRTVEIERERFFGILIIFTPRHVPHLQHLL